MISFMISDPPPKTDWTRLSRQGPNLHRGALDQASAGQGRAASGQREPRRSRGAIALNVSAPLTADEIAERLPTLQEKLDAEQLDSVQGKLSKYLEF